MKLELSEFDEQCCFFNWIRSPFVLKKYPALKWTFCTGNGLRLTIGQAMKYKQQGGKKGVLDVAIIAARGPYHGLFIEMKKKKKGVVSPEQKEFIADVTKEGYRAVVCRGAREAIAEVEEYFKLPKHESNGK